MKASIQFRVQFGAVGGGGEIQEQDNPAVVRPKVPQSRKQKTGASDPTDRSSSPSMDT